METKSTNPKDKIGVTKPSLHLIPAAAAITESKVLELGAKKYGPFNWRDSTVAATVYVSAAYRHLAQWVDGDDADSESGVSHLGHARACLGILLDAEACGNMVDDRPTKGVATKLIEEFTTTSDAVKIMKKRFSEESFEVEMPEPDPDMGDHFGQHLVDSGCPRGVAGQIVKGVTPSYEKGSRCVYISGPMRGLKDYNFAAFDKARNLLHSQGFSVISPADIDRGSVIPEEGANRVYILRDFFALFALNAYDENSGGRPDAIVMLPGWEGSVGATAEFFLARWLGLEVLNEKGEVLTGLEPGIVYSINSFLKGQIDVD